MCGRKKFRHGTPIDGRYLALGGRKVNIRGPLLVSEEEEKRRKMKGAMIAFTILFAFAVSAIAGMGTGQSGGMMRGGWWWGVNSAWYYWTIITILIVFGIFSILKRR